MIRFYLNCQYSINLRVTHQPVSAGAPAQRCWFALTAKALPFCDLNSEVVVPASSRCLDYTHVSLKEKEPSKLRLKTDPEEISTLWQIRLLQC